MNDRDAAGRFVPGNSGGPGRPPRATETEYLETLTEVVTPERWRAICQRAVADAEQGDARARAWVARYMIGEDTVWERERAIEQRAQAAFMYPELGGYGPSDNIRERAKRELERRKAAGTYVPSEKSS